MAKLATLSGRDGWAVGCVGVLSLRCVCLAATKVIALISRTTRMTPVTMWGTGGKCRDRFDDGTLPLPLAINTLPGYGGNRVRGLDRRQCRGTVNLG